MIRTLFQELYTTWDLSITVEQTENEKKKYAGVRFLVPCQLVEHPFMVKVLHQRKMV